MMFLKFPKLARVPASNVLYAGTVPASNFLYAGTVPASNCYLNYIQICKYLIINKVNYLNVTAKLIVC